jgi:methylmalonyl-CoA mutase cobalamin-binding domain/chain
MLPDELKRLREEWEKNELREFLDRQPESRERFETLSGIPVQRVYTPEDLDGTPFEAIGFPGKYPFTRGAYPTMYRARPWTIRQIAGFGSAEDTNRRFRYLIDHGQTALSAVFDMPTLMGYDSDDPRAHGEVGLEGAAVDTIDDMAAMFAGIDLTRTSVSMTINPTAWILLAMYLALAEERGNPPETLSGTTQADILKEYVAEKEWIYPIRPSLRLVRDMIVHSARNLPRYNPISISGYHISEAGGSSLQELAFTMCNAIAYLDEVTRAGVHVDDFAPRLAFFFVAQQDFFEEVAKFRAARRIWARIVKERYGAKKPESMRLRFHCQTAAATLTRGQPMNNVVRTALQALSAVLGGAQSLHTNALDEAYAIPSEEAAKIALRTQQIIAEETRIPNVVDPLGGSYYVESLTTRIEREVLAILDKVASMGGTVQAIEEGWFQREIADTAYQTLKKRASGEQPVVGVNTHVEPHRKERLDLHKADRGVEERQIARTRQVRKDRDGVKLGRLLDALAEQARDPDVNLMPGTIAAVKARATIGEIVACLKTVFGTHAERPGF